MGTAVSWIEMLRVVATKLRRRPGICRGPEGQSLNSLIDAECGGDLTKKKVDIMKVVF